MGVGLCLFVDACSSSLAHPHANTDAAADTGHKQDATEPDGALDLRTVDDNVGPGPSGTQASPTP
jgi:hypothetical protein